MFLLPGLYLLLIALLQPTKQTVETEAAPTPVFNYGEISVKDQIALDLNLAFNANTEDTNKVFRISNKAAKITSSQPFNVVEFEPHCIKYNSAYQDPQYISFSAICNKNELFEIKLDKATYRIVTTEKIVKTAGNCLDSRWSEELNIYTLFCEEESIVQGNIGDVHIHTVDRTKKTIIGSAKISKSVGNYGMAFTEKSIISQVMLPTGTSYGSKVQFLIYDQPYIDQTDDVKSKPNLFFLIFGVDADNKPQKIRYIDIKQQGIEDFKQFKKISGIQHLKFSEEYRLMITGYQVGETHMKTLICSVVAEASQSADISVYATEGPHFSNCSEMQTSKNMAMGQLQFFSGENYKIALKFNKLTSKIKICKYDDTNAFEALSVCTEISSRINEEPDLEFAYFDRCSITACNVVYVNAKKTRFLGIDYLEITDSKTSGLSVVLKNRFKTWAKCARVEGNKLYISKGNYLEAYDDKRSEKVVVLGEELTPNSNFNVVVEKLHQDDHKLVNITGFRIEQVLMPVKREIEFPKLEGQVGRMYKLPFSRKYFTGNDLTFKLSNSANIKTELSYINPVVYQLDKKDFSPKIAIVGLSSKVFQTFDNRWIVAKCYLEVETGTNEKDIKCSTIRQGQLQAGEEILNIFEDSEAYVFMTQKGRVYAAVKNIKQEPVIFEIGEPIVDLELKRTGDYTIVAVITESKKIRVFIKELFNNKNPTELGEPITSYQKEPHQNTAGEFCPKMLTFKLEEKPRMIVLNACDDKDRRIIEYDLLGADGKYGIFYKNNQFILSSFFMSGNLRICAGLNNLYIANLDGKQLEGIGYNDSYTIEDLGVDSLEIKKIRQILCSGENNIGMVAEKSDGIYITTFFTKKFSEASDRIHSSFKLPDGSKNVRGSSDNKITIYSVEFEDGTTKVYYVNLKGPHIHVETTAKNHADYGQGGWIIGEVNLKVMNEKNQNSFALSIDFRDVNEQAAVSSKSENFEIVKDKEYSVDEHCQWDGPVFSYIYNEKVATVTQRLGNLERLLNAEFIEKSKILALDHIQYLNKHIFGMGQMEAESHLVIINNMNGAISEVDLKHRCSKISVAARGFGPTQPVYDIQAVCLDKGLYKLAHIRVDVTKEAKDMLILMNFAQNTQNVKNFDLARLDDQLTLSATVQKDTEYLNLAYYDPTKVVGGEDFAYTRYYEEKNVEKVQLIDEGLASDNIFMMYSQSGAQEISLKMISKKSKQVISKEKLNIDEIGSSTLVDFDCHYNKKEPAVQEPSIEDTVWCVFAVPTTFIYKVVYNKNLFTGLMMASKSKYYLYSDTYPIKIVSNSLYIALLAKSPKTGLTYLLIYKDHQKNGSQFLYSGLDLSSKGLSDGEKLIIDITDDHTVLITSRKDESFLMKLPIQEMKITVLTEDQEALKASKIDFNEGTDYPKQSVPISYFFVPDYKQERMVQDKSSTVFLWVLLAAFVLVSLVLILFLQFNQRKMARQILMSGVDTKQYQPMNQQGVHLSEDSATTYYVQEMPGGFYQE